MNRFKRRSPQEVAEDFINRNVDQDGLEKRYINEDIGNIFTISYFKL